MYLDRWCHRISVASTNPQFCGDCGDDGILAEAIHFEALIPEECDGSCGIGFEGGGAYEGTDRVVYVVEMLSVGGTVRRVRGTNDRSREAKRRKQNRAGTR